MSSYWVLLHVIVPFICCYAYYWRAGKKFILGGLGPKSLGLALWFFGLLVVVQLRGTVEVTPFAVATFIFPYLIAQSMYKKDGRGFLINGLLPISAILIVYLFIKGISFPGHCAPAEGGLVCCKPGLLSYLFFHNMKLNVAFGELTFIALCFFEIPLILLISQLVARMQRRGTYMRVSVFGILLVAAISLAYSAATQDWLPKTDTRTTVGYGYPVSDLIIIRNRSESSAKPWPGSAEYFKDVKQ